MLRRDPKGYAFPWGGELRAALQYWAMRPAEGQCKAGMSEIDVAAGMFCALLPRLFTSFRYFLLRL